MRWLSEDQHGELDWDLLPYDRDFGAERSRVRLNDVAELPDDWRLTLAAENVSDTEYFEDFSSGPEGASTAFLNRSADLSYRTEHWRVDATAQQYQTIDTSLVDSHYSIGSTLLLRYGFDSEVVDFHRDIEGPDNNGWRADLMPRVSLDLT